MERLLAAVRSGNDITEPLDALHAALQSAGDALGVYGRRTRGVKLAGVGNGPLEIDYECPIARCAGRRWPDHVDASAHCAISGKKLNRKRRF